MSKKIEIQSKKLLKYPVFICKLQKKIKKRVNKKYPSINGISEILNSGDRSKNITKISLALFNFIIIFHLAINFLKPI